MRDKQNRVPWALTASKDWNGNYAEVWLWTPEAWIAARLAEVEAHGAALGDDAPNEWKRDVTELPDGRVRYRAYSPGGAHALDEAERVPTVELDVSEAFLPITVREYGEGIDFPVVWRAETIDGMHAEIRYDEDGRCADPRDMTNVGMIVHWHRRYEIASDAERVNDDRFPNIRSIGRYLGIVEKAICILPLGMIDHSGVSYYVGSGDHWCDPGGWDSGQVGFIYATAESCAEVGIDPTDTEAVEQALRGEVAALDAYARGEVFYYMVEDDAGTHYDSCSGFLAVDDVSDSPLRGNRSDPLAYIKSEAMDSLLLYAAEEAVERERAANQDIATVSA